MGNQLNKLVFFTTCLVFFLFGIYNGGMGPVLHELAEHTGVTLGTIGVIFTAIYTGSLLTQFTSGLLTSRLGRLRVMILSVLFMSIGIFGMTTARSLSVLTAACFVLGLGQGGVDMIANILVVEAYPQRKVQVLNILHILYGVGASTGPLLISFVLRTTGRGLIIEQAVALCLIPTLFAFIYIEKRSPEEHKPARQNEINIERKTSSPLLKDSVVWILSLLLLMVVGTQFSAGSWVNTFLTETYETTPAKAAMITSLYWLLITVSRLITIPLTRFISQTKIMFLSIVGSIVAAAFFVMTIGREHLSISAILAISLFLGSLYPLLLALIPEYYGNNIDNASSIIVSMGTVGGLILPWLAGLILNGAGAKPYSTLLLISMGLILLLATILSNKLKHR